MTEQPETARVLGKEEEEDNMDGSLENKAEGEDDADDLDAILENMGTSFPHITLR